MTRSSSGKLFFVASDYWLSPRLSFSAEAAMAARAAGRIFRAADSALQPTRRDSSEETWEGVGAGGIVGSGRGPPVAGCCYQVNVLTVVVVVGGATDVENFDLENGPELCPR